MLLGQGVEGRLTAPGRRLQRRQRHMHRVPIIGALATQAEERLGSPADGVVQQALVDVADLFDIQRPEAELAPLASAAGHGHFQELQGLQQMQDGAVVDGQRFGGVPLPDGMLRPPLQNGILVGIEQGAAIGAQAQPVVGNTAVHGAEGGEQAAPGIEPAFQDFLALGIGLGAQGRSQGGDGVVVVPQRLPQQQEAAFLGVEQEHEPHHHRQGGLVQLRLGHMAQQVAAALETVDAVDAADQHLHRRPHLTAELVGDFGLILGALDQERRQPVGLGHADHPLHAEERPESPEQLAFLTPVLGIPGGRAGRLSRPGMHQHPRLAIGQQAKRNTGTLQEFDGPRQWRGLPAPAGHRPLQPLPRSLDDHQHGGGPGCRIKERERRQQRHPLGGDAHRQARRQRLALGNQLGRPIEQPRQHPLNPGTVNLEVRAVRPLGEPGGGPGDKDALLAIDRQPLRKHPQQHRQRQERSARLDQAKPVGMLTGGGVGAAHGGQRSNRMGTRNVIPTGNR